MLRNPDPVIAELCEHMLEHNAEVSEGVAGPVLRLGEISTRFSRMGEETLVDIVAPDLEGLYLARMSVASPSSPGTSSRGASTRSSVSASTAICPSR